MHRCHDCKRDFPSLHDLTGHLNSRRHAQSTPGHYCRSCNKLFCNDQALNQHLLSPVHNITQFHCCDCDRDFTNEAALLQHLRDKIHEPKPRAAPRKNIICDLCKKTFNNKTALKQHQASPAHKPICPPISCIGSQGCNKTFTSPSAMIHHLESGTCISSLSRHKVNEIVVLNDTNHVITSQRAIEAVEAIPPSPTSPDDSWMISTPLSSSGISMFEQSDSWNCLLGESVASLEGIDTPEASISVSTSALCEKSSDSTGRSWFLCPLCPPTSNRFKTAQDLQKHSTSPAHAPKIFHCPTMLLNQRKPKVTKTFSTLSGVAMHIESGACSGGKKAFEKVLNFVNERLQDLGFRQIHVLEG
jgi:hypothetical protein